jgi:hypothetical protein
MRVSMSRTIEQRTNVAGYPKAGEWIEMTGLDDLEASQRAISNLLYQHAHDSGRIAEPDAIFEIPMAQLRSAISKHESGDRLRQSLTKLMHVVAQVTYTAPGREGHEAEERVLTAGLFRFFDTTLRHLAGVDRHPGEIIPMGSDQGRGVLLHEVEVRDGALRNAGIAPEHGPMHRDLRA